MFYWKLNDDVNQFTGTFENYTHLFIFLVNHTWSKLQQKGHAPSSRTAHAATSIGKKVFIHGGMSAVGAALDDVYSLDTG